MSMVTAMQGRPLAHARGSVSGVRLTRNYAVAALRAMPMAVRRRHPEEDHAEDIRFPHALTAFVFLTADLGEAVLLR
jgi:hypothetical protein